MSKLVADHVPMPGCLAKAYQSRRNDLLEYCCRRVNDSMLDEIARKDSYGFYEAHRATLEKIALHADVQKPPEWEPREVLALGRWENPLDTPRYRWIRRAREHRMRAFCCAALLLVASLPDEELSESDNSELVRLLESSFDHDAQLREFLARFLVWRYSSLRSYDESMFHAFTLVCCAIIDEKELGDEEMGELCEWLERVESFSRENGCFRDDAWMVGLTFFGQDFPKWKRVAEQARAALDGSSGPGCGRMVGLLDRVIDGVAG